MISADQAKAITKPKKTIFENEQQIDSHIIHCAKEGEYSTMLLVYKTEAKAFISLLALKGYEILIWDTLSSDNKLECIEISWA